MLYQIKFSFITEVNLLLFLYEFIDFELADCSDLYKGDYYSTSYYNLDLNLQSYVNCVQAQNVKIKTQLVKMQSQIAKMTAGRANDNILHSSISIYLSSYIKFVPAIALT